MVLKGVAASTGIGIGKVTLLRQEDIQAPLRAVTDANDELSRWRQAVNEFCEQISQAGKSVSKYLGSSEAGIITAQIVLVQDPEVQEEIHRRVKEQAENIEHAFSQVFDGYIDMFSALEDELMRARAADFRDIKQRLLAILTGAQQGQTMEIPRGSVLVSDDISPSQAVSIKPGLVSAIITRTGTQFSHIAILCRAGQIPGVVGVDDILKLVHEGDDIIVDGGTGEIIITPTSEELNRYEQRRVQYQMSRSRLDSYKNQRTHTRDGKRVLLSANLTVPRELPEIIEQGVAGIGLYRSEYLFMTEDSLPNEHKQYLSYKTVAQTMGNRPSVIRTLDAGGVKEISYLTPPEEDNPLMGFRAVRHSLKNVEMFKEQLRALLRASAFGNVHILLPLITSLSELRRVRALLETCKGELREREISFDPGIPLGVMIETPAAALCARSLAREADYFSIGTNDLTQYTLAVDRGNKLVNESCNVLHPAVLRLIHETIQAANEVSIPVSICGDAASDAMLLPFLVGSGIHGLSVNPDSILPVREQIGNLNYLYWRERVPEILELSTIEEVVAYIKDNWAERR